MASKERIILGIDPGTVVTGYGIVRIESNKLSVVAAGVIDLGKLDDHHIKLKRIFDRTVGLIDEFCPDELSIEAPFFGKNVQSMLKLGRAQGVAIAAALSRSIPVCEYSPRKIKQSITGNGNASKEQVATMLQTILSFEELPKFLDATDGLAAAVCHYFQSGNTNAAPSKIKTKSKKQGGWKAFLSNNPSRLA
ncbi:MAG: crossover junction endodeoxyribonuclease RuvC [Bacteroidota bacterium]